MRILVIGNTAQAAWLTSRLHELKANVQWWADVATASFTIKHNSTATKVENLPIVADLATALEPAPDWIIMATPAWQVDPPAMTLLQTFPMGKYPKFLCLTHGIGATEKLRNYFGDDNVMRGVLSANMRWHATQLMIEGDLGVVLSETDYQALPPILTQSELWGGAVSFAEDKSLAWSDVFWQMQTNALAVILDVDSATIYENPAYFAIEYQQLQEALAVIRQEGVKLVALTAVNVPRLAQMVRWLPKALLKTYLKKYAKYPSLRDDIANEVGRSDAAYLNGAVAYAGNEVNISIPVNHALAVTLTDIAEGRAQKVQFKDNIDYLVTIIRIMSRH